MLIIFVVKVCSIPKCFAFHVTVSPSSMSPEVRPAIAFSPVLKVDF
ncbi:MULTISPECIES: hypothetical protein [unclassified Chryseobacterium]|nr:MULTISPECIES: hypothetical protein [unclassified Chryseobacterium]